MKIFAVVKITKNVGKLIKLTLRGLCKHPWAVDKEISRFELIKQTTVTANKNKLSKAGFFSRQYIPSYHQLGFPFLSFSQLRNSPSNTVNIKKILNQSDGKTIISFMIQDPINSLLLAYHNDFKSFENFKRNCGNEYIHDVYGFKGSIKIINFNFTNIVNRKYFPKDFDIFKPLSVNTSHHLFKRKKTVQAFQTLINNPGKDIKGLSNISRLSRPTLAGIRSLMKMEGLLERTIIINTEKIGISLIVFLRVCGIDNSEKSINIIHKCLRPFYYWIFKENHYLIGGFSDYRELVFGIKQLKKEIKIDIISIQLFDVSMSELKFNFGMK